MYRFDSRFLRQFDSVTRQFTETGEFFYHLAVHTRLGKVPRLDSMAKIKVAKESSDTPRQHRISITYDKASRSFVPSPAELTVNRKDTVQWHKPGNDGHGYYVAVMDAKGKKIFTSQSLHNNAVFTHFFSHPGDYRYRNILSDSHQRPVIRVYQVDPSKADWPKLSTTPVLIRFSDGKFTPDDVRVPEGGTVIWLIEGSEPVAIQLDCYDLKKIDPDMIPRPPRGKKGCKPDTEDDGCKG
ncbi:MAG: hypothetical protein R3208_04035 [Ketobacteraceae bacterium]|nr:hypothetical protein [Ketobacteraceae bacterium]